MFKFFTSTLMVLAMIPSVAFSQFTTSESGSHKQNMKQAGALFKEIGASINEPGKNPANAQSAANMAEFFKLAFQQTPKSLKEMPEFQRAEALKGFQDLIQQCIEHSLSLEQAFLKDDNEAAAKLYQEMKELKKEGHGQFDP
ncbi:MAG: cytochrome b562 [Pseudobdellovibrionaceae bacterium]